MKSTQVLTALGFLASVSLVSSTSLAQVSWLDLPGVDVQKTQTKESGKKRAEKSQEKSATPAQASSPIAKVIAKPVAQAPAPAKQVTPAARPAAPIAAPAPVVKSEPSVEVRSEPNPTHVNMTITTHGDNARARFDNQTTVSLPIRVTKSEWTDQDEQDYSAFVRKLGLAIQKKNVTRINEVMHDPNANMFASTDPRELVFYSDCAEFPYFLRAYFAYKRGLPFGFATEERIARTAVASVNDKASKLTTARLDNSPYGNEITARGGSNIAREFGQEPNFIPYLHRMFNEVSTRTLRVGPMSPSYDLADLYPIHINRHDIQPGSVVHSTGHAMVVFDIDPAGRVHVIDAHPDGTVFGYKVIQPGTLDRSRPDQGLGFYRFRSLRTTGGTISNQELVGATIVNPTARELYDRGVWSTEQWFGAGNNVPNGRAVSPTLWQHAFQQVSFFDYLSQQLRQSGVTRAADEVTGDSLVNMCDEFQSRVDTVNGALQANPPMNTVAHPNVLPEDIFAADGNWEDFSSPGNDARMRNDAVVTAKQAIENFKKARASGSGVTFNGNAEDYQKAILSRMALMNSTCKVTYAKSDGSKQTLSFSQLLSRLTRMSFDPYHCAERRWGATGAELQSCRDQDSEGRWYSAEQVMRNTIGKVDANDVEVVRSDRPITLSMLADPSNLDQPSSAAVNLGASKSQVVNLNTYFASPAFLNDLQK